MSMTMNGAGVPGSVNGPVEEDERPEKMELLVGDVKGKVSAPRSAERKECSS